MARQTAQARRPAKKKQKRQGAAGAPDRAALELRARRLLEQPIEFIYSDEFEEPDADRTILAPPPEGPGKKGLMKAPPGLPPYLASLYELPLLTREQESYYFRKLNYLKFKAAGLREGLNPRRAGRKRVEEIEELLRQATEVKNLLIRRNLRLVVSVAKKYVKPGTNLFELISDGNMTLMRAIEKFDYTRGFKLSTYATWAIRNNFARTIPAEHTQLGRFRTGSEELFQRSRDERSSQFEQERTNERQHEALMTILSRLQDREREIIARRFGLERGTEPETLEEVGQHFGVTKERIRQLEARALRKLREAAEEEKLDIPGI